LLLEVTFELYHIPTSTGIELHLGVISVYSVQLHDSNHTYKLAILNNQGMAV